jgi:transcriptional regulator with XRE-family HTH domain
MSLQDVFIGNMRKYRKQTGLTQEKLAELCDTDPCYIGQLETGRRCPSLSYIEKIAAALKVAPYQLFYEEVEGIGLSALTVRAKQKQTMKTTLINRVSEDIQKVIDELYDIHLSYPL